MLLSFKMFLYDGSIFELVHAQHTTAFLELYFFVFYAAVLTSTSAIIMLFGKRAMTLFALCFRKKKFKHVFIGMNKRSESIVRNIRGEEVALIEFPSDTSENEISIQNVIKGVSREEKTEFSASGQSNISVLFAKQGKDGVAPVHFQSQPCGISGHSPWRDHSGRTERRGLGERGKNGTPALCTLSYGT